MSSVKKIAEMAQVSVATVSRVMHQSDKVRPEKRRRVEEVMQALGITANDLVRSAKTDAQVVGVVVPDLTNIFFSEVIAGIQDVAKSLDISVFVCNTQEDDQTEIHYLRLLKEAHVRGIIITPASDDDDSVNNEYLHLLNSMKIPIVLLDRDVKYAHYDAVFIDNVRGAYEATHLLLKNGHDRIALIAGPLNTKPGRDRLQGYREAFLAQGKTADETLIFYGDFSIASGRACTSKILEKHPDVTAIFSTNNLMTLGCLDTLTKAHKKIPQNISVIGFDEMVTLEMLGIYLTVVDRPTGEMGRQAMKLLAKAIGRKGSGVPRRVTLMPELKLRGSEKLCREAEREAQKSEGGSTE